MDSDLFKLEFVGEQFNTSLVTYKIGEKRTKEEYIDIALVRNVDNAFSKLQKKNDVFKPKIPVLSIDPIIVPIGQKESINSKSEFEILEMVWNEKEGKTEWVRIDKCKVDSKVPIWDNRYGIDNESTVALTVVKKDQPYDNVSNEKKVENLDKEVSQVSFCETEQIRLLLYISKKKVDLSVMPWLSIDDEIEVIQEGGYYKYYSGNYKSKGIAERERLNVQKLGFSNAQVIVLKNEPIENNKQRKEKKDSKKVAESEELIADEGTNNANINNSLIINGTVMKGSKKVKPGMLIKQIK